MKCQKCGKKFKGDEPLCPDCQNLVLITHNIPPWEVEQYARIAADKERKESDKERKKKPVDPESKKEPGSDFDAAGGGVQGEGAELSNLNQTADGGSVQNVDEKSSITKIKPIRGRAGDREETFLERLIGVVIHTLLLAGLLLAVSIILYKLKESKEHHTVESFIIEHTRREEAAAKEKAAKEEAAKAAEAKEELAAGATAREGLSAERLPPARASSSTSFPPLPRYESAPLLIEIPTEETGPSSAEAASSTSTSSAVQPEGSSSAESLPAAGALVTSSSSNAEPAGFSSSSSAYLSTLSSGGKTVQFELAAATWYPKYRRLEIAFFESAPDPRELKELAGKSSLRIGAGGKVPNFMLSFIFRPGAALCSVEDLDEFYTTIQRSAFGSFYFRGDRNVITVRHMTDIPKTLKLKGELGSGKHCAVSYSDERASDRKEDPSFEWDVAADVTMAGFNGTEQ